MSPPVASLDPEAHARVYKEKVLPKSSFNATTPQEAPRAIILAGQPGAGKGGLVIAAEKEFSQNVVTIDPDDLRRHHPNVEKFREAHPYTWSGDTHTDASAWASELRDKAVEGRRNLIIDTTLGNPGRVSEMIRQLQAKGYIVKVRAMASRRPR